LNTLKYIFIILILLAHGIASTLLVVNYELNKNYISEKLCENTNNKNLKCEGKCYLNKKIKEQNDQENKCGKDSKKTDTLYWMIADLTHYQWKATITKSITSNTLYHKTIPQNIHLSIFQPPELLIIISNNTMTLL